LKNHLKIDAEVIESDIAEKKLMVRRRYFPYEIKDINTIFTDERLIIEIQESINWRSARLRQHKRLLEKVERVEKMISEELHRLN
jgi:hypothetical protein